MSRSCYSDDYGDDFPGQLELFRANVARSVASKKGQARLMELRDALIALPEKKLANEIFLQDGEACALGVWAKAHAPEMEGFDGDDHETAERLKSWPRLVVMDLIYENDRDSPVYFDAMAPHESPYAYFHQGSWPLRCARDETDEERYARVLAWVEERIKSGEQG